MRWRLKSLASRLLTQSFIQAQIKESINAPRHWPLCGELIGDRWIPRTKTSNAENVSLWWRRPKDYATTVLSVLTNRLIDTQDLLQIQLCKNQFVGIYSSGRLIQLLSCFVEFHVVGYFLIFVRGTNSHIPRLFEMSQWHLYWLQHLWGH